MGFPGTKTRYILIEFFISLGLDPPNHPGRVWGLGGTSLRGTQDRPSRQRVVPFGKLRINSRLTMSGGTLAGFLDRIP